MTETTPILSFVNDKTGPGEVSLVYHAAWMYADLGLRVLAGDLDPQANLTAAFLDEDRVEAIWNAGRTVYGSIEPVMRGVGDIGAPHVEIPDPAQSEVGLVCGDIRLSGFEDDLSENWPKCLDGREAAFRSISAFWRILQQAATQHEADLVLVDLGPNLGAINRSALISADVLVLPLSPDLFSLQGLKNLGPTIRRWRDEWAKRLEERPAGLDLPLPAARMKPLGYVVLQHSVRLDRPVKAYEKWIARIPQVYRDDVLAEPNGPSPPVQEDPHCVALLKHYRSLMPMAQEARKPIFHLKPADGAIGSHLDAVKAARQDFEHLARQVAQRAGLPLPSGGG